MLACPNCRTHDDMIFIGSTSPTALLYLCIHMYKRRHNTTMDVHVLLAGRHRCRTSTFSPWLSQSAGCASVSSHNPRRMFVHCAAVAKWNSLTDSLKDTALLLLW